MTLFEPDTWRQLEKSGSRAKKQVEREAPLAARMRPRGFGEFVGQEHLYGECGGYADGGH